MRKPPDSDVKLSRQERQNRDRRRKYAEDPTYRLLVKQKARDAWHKRMKSPDNRWKELWRKLRRFHGEAGVRFYQEKIQYHGQVCEICGYEADIMSDNRETRSLCLDHDHDTGKFRGLLCPRCNRVLGSIKDDVELLRKMVQYLLGRGGNDEKFLGPHPPGTVFPPIE